MTSPICTRKLSPEAIGDRLPGVRSKDLPRCGICDCRYSCTCEDYRYRTRACKHQHAVHSLYYTIPAAKGEEPDVWLTVTDLGIDAENGQEREALTDPIVHEEDIFAEQSSPSLAHPLLAPIVRTPRWRR